MARCGNTNNSLYQNITYSLAFMNKKKFPDKITFQFFIFFYFIDKYIKF